MSSRVVSIIGLLVLNVALGFAEHSASVHSYKGLLIALAVVHVMALPMLVAVYVQSRRAVSIIGLIATFTLATIAAIISLAPIVWLVAASIKLSVDRNKYLFFPPLHRWTFTNYTGLMGYKDGVFWHYLLNSVFVTDVGVIGSLFFCSLAGFALAKYEFKGKKAIMTVMLATMLLPGQVTMATLYEELFHFHFIDNFAGIIVPGLVGVFGIFLFRQSILQVPDELIQAARIDGCSEFRIYWDIVMPITRPMIGAFSLMGFMGAWNNFLWPQIILHHDQFFTLPIGLNQLSGQFATRPEEWGWLMAGTLISVLPVAILFLFLQKEFVAGLTAGAIKG
ncbi:MAG: carbohydrate ABC transporter permease [Capsulimonadaceae bacterium]